MSKPLWSNYRIGSLTSKVRGDGPYYFTADGVIRAARLVRDDYERERVHLKARIAQLEAELAALRTVSVHNIYDDAMLRHAGSCA